MLDRQVDPIHHDVRAVGFPQPADLNVGHGVPRLCEPAEAVHRRGAYRICL
jgi:hypothetical protein